MLDNKQTSLLEFCSIPQTPPGVTEHLHIGKQFGQLMQTILAGAIPSGESGYKSLHNLNLSDKMYSIVASQLQVTGFISGLNFVLMLPVAMCVKAQPHSRPSMRLL